MLYSVAILHPEKYTKNHRLFHLLHLGQTRDLIVSLVTDTWVKGLSLQTSSELSSMYQSIDAQGGWELWRSAKMRRFAMPCPEKL